MKKAVTTKRAKTAKLPEMSEGDKLPVDKLYGEQHFTTPPPRYNEATLVKALEEYGIGRPRPTPASSPRSKTVNTLP